MGFFDKLKKAFSFEPEKEENEARSDFIAGNSGKILFHPWE